MKQASVWVALAAIVMCGHSLSAQEPQPFPLEGFVITAAPFPSAVSTLGNHVSVLEGAELRGAGVTQVVDALRTVPGLAVARTGSFGGIASVFFRGSESDHVLVLIDGVQVNQPGGSFDFSGLTTEAVERIEVLRGPASVLHGSDAIAGVIHIVTERGLRGGRVDGEAGAGTYGTREGSLRVSGRGERGGYSLSVGRYDTEGVLAFNNDHLNTVVSGHAELRPDPRSRVSLAARYGQREFHFPTDFSGNVVDHDQFSFSDETSLSLEVQRQLSESVDVRVLFSGYAVDGGTEDFADSASDTLGFFGFQSLDAYRRGAVDARVGWRASDRLRLTGGAEVERQSVRSFNASQSQFGDGGGRDSNRRSNRAAYAHLSADIEDFYLNLGARQEDNERYGGFTSLQVSLSRPLWSEARVRGAWGRGVKEPTFFETFASGFARGNPDLEPERSTSWEVGFEQALWDGALAFQSTYFNQSLRDLIQYTGSPPTVGGPNYFNAAEAAARGVEVGGRLSLDRVDLSVDWTHLDTEVIDAGFDEGESATFVNGERMLRRPTDQWSASTASALGIARVHARVSWVGNRADRDFTQFPAVPVELEGYTTLSVGLEVPLLRERFAVYFRGDNLTDAEYQEVFGFVAPGRTLRVGGRFSLDLN